MREGHRLLLVPMPGEEAWPRRPLALLLAPISNSDLWFISALPVFSPFTIMSVP